MKRSDYVGLGAVGVILAAFVLSEKSDDGSGGTAPAAEPQERAVIYADVEECRRAGVLDTETCEREFGSARSQHVSVAPKFLSQGECETSYGPGRCQSAIWNGASVFVPALAGFMIANHLSAGRSTQPLMPGIVGRGQSCPPGQVPQQVGAHDPNRPPVPGAPGLQQAIPNCVPAQARSGSTTGSGWRSYSTARGDSIYFDSSSSRRNEVAVPREAATRPAARYSYGTPSAPARASFSSSSSVSRGGFGSSGRSFFSSSSS